MGRARIFGALFVLVTLVTFLPLGCGNKLGPIRATPNGGTNQSNYPDRTVERFRECVAEHGSLLQPGYHAFDSKVEVGEDGLKYGVEIEKLPESGEEFGACMRTALQDMAISERYFDAAMEIRKNQRQQEEAASAEQKQLMGSPIVVVVVGVTIVVSEVVLEAGAITILFATTVTLIDQAATTLKRRIRDRDWKKCLDEYESCIASPLYYEEGKHIRDTRCGLCIGICRTVGKWPASVSLGPCTVPRGN